MMYVSTKGLILLLCIGLGNHSYSVDADGNAFLSLSSPANTQEVDNHDESLTLIQQLNLKPLPATMRKVLPAPFVDCSKVSGHIFYDKQIGPEEKPNGKWFSETAIRDMYIGSKTNEGHTVCKYGIENHERKKAINLVESWQAIKASLSNLKKPGVDILIDLFELGMIGGLDETQNLRSRQIGCRRQQVNRFFEVVKKLYTMNYETFFNFPVEVFQKRILENKKSPWSPSNFEATKNKWKKKRSDFLVGRISDTDIDAISSQWLFDILRDILGDTSKDIEIVGIYVPEMRHLRRADRNASEEYIFFWDGKTYDEKFLGEVDAGALHLDPEAYILPSDLPPQEFLDNVNEDKSFEFDVKFKKQDGSTDGSITLRKSESNKQGERQFEIVDTNLLDIVRNPGRFVNGEKDIAGKLIGRRIGKEIRDLIVGGSDTAETVFLEIRYDY